VKLSSILIKNVTVIIARVLSALTCLSWLVDCCAAVSEEREEEYERAKRRIFNEMMSPAPHYKYSINLGSTKAGATTIFILPYHN
jgi:hypothetical protein